MRCEATKKSGGRCRAAALRGQTKCSLHTDRGRARELGSRGGSARQRLTVQDVVELCTPDNAGDCKRLLGLAIAQVSARKMSTGVAHAIASLASIFLKASDQADLETRVSRLEELSHEARNAAKPRKLEKAMQVRGPSRPPDLRITIVRTETVLLANGNRGVFDLPCVDYVTKELEANSDGSRYFLHRPRRLGEGTK